MNDSRMSGLGASPSQYFARQRIESLVNVPRLFAAIDADPGIVGAGVVYIDADYNVVTLREFRPICSVLPKRVVLREVKRHLAPMQYVDQLVHHPRESQVVTEALKASATCAGAVIALRAVLDGPAVKLFSPPIALAIKIVGTVVAGAGLILCGIGSVSTALEIHDPELNDKMMEQEWYRTIVPLLDSISLLGAAVSTHVILRYLQMRKAATGNSWFDLSRPLSRQQRKALTKEILSIRHPSLTANQLKLKKHLESLPKRYSNTELNNTTLSMIRDAVGVALAVPGSAILYSIVVALYEEFES
ncbi:NAD synthetase [Pseudomonas sp. JV241A]|uniref:NAD synthetase n=1 Tax=Pseudomonas sp. JV241A TaxID=2078785 RepID=UPI000F9055B8|nr:NAD synthetase [Pseudomonas sp. JV241A]SPO67100.1 conserved membrane protein of unknown function [Pseudomonas sp. JV241A]